MNQIEYSQIRIVETNRELHIFECEWQKITANELFSNVNSENSLHIEFDSNCALLPRQAAVSCATYKDVL